MDKYILIVDDSPSMRKLFETVLKREKYSITSSKDGLEAQTLLKTRIYDLVISDEEMPFMSGSQLAVWMRGEELHRDTPFILASGKQDPKLFARLIKDKVISAYIPKPFQNNALLQIVNVCLEYSNNHNQ